MSFKTLTKKVKKYNPQAEVELLEKAYHFAENSHHNQYRKSGELFILHPLGVAEILADLELDTSTIVAALLHDVVEDTDLTLDLVVKELGKEVHQLIDGVTKLDKIEFKTYEEEQAENLRKMFIAMAKDIRVILIKLADRLHNMRTLTSLPPKRQQEIARETLEIYAPLAHRLGIFSLKCELEDLSFSILEPKKYQQIKKMVREKAGKRETQLNKVIKFLKKEFKKEGIEANISGRPKHLYSIYQKIVKKGREFDEIYDLVALRILVKDVKECYEVLGVIHSLWKPVPGRFKDYIAMPKFNMYQSLHTTVIGPEGRPLEIQIKTESMHQTAEYGIAAHWRYKEGKARDKFDEKLSWLRHILEWQSELKDPKEFMESLKIDLFSDEVFVFTPKGKVISLPRGATPLDFAYTIHTEVGHSCIGAKANNKIVPLDYELKMGDIVEILTSKGATGPSQDWINLVKTSRARNKIRQHFSKKRQEDDEHLGKEMFFKKIKEKRLKISSSLQEDALKKIARNFNFAKAENLFASIGAGKTSLNQVLTKFFKIFKKEKVSEKTEDVLKELVSEAPKKAKEKIDVKVKGVEDILVNLAKCCNPVPRDKIIGFVTRGKGVSVHRQDCPNAKGLLSAGDRLIEVLWDVKKGTTFSVEIEVEALDRKKLLRDISNVIGEAGVNILTASATTTKEQTALFRFVFEISSLKHLENILKNIRRIDTVFDANRVLSH